MNLAGQQRLARAAFAGDEQRGRRVGQALHEVVHPPHGGRRAEQPGGRRGGQGSRGASAGGGHR
ncbi:MAG: hypothetical protein ACKOHG_01180, partial [Planctomycetia bacterium]